MTLKKYLFLFLLSVSISVFSQDKNYALGLINKLASPEMFGRGYVNKGEKIAAKYIRKEFKKNGLKSFSNNYFQKFLFSINTFPEPIFVSIDGKELKSGTEFLIECSSPAIAGTYGLVWINNTKINTEEHHNLSNKFIVTNLKQKELADLDLPKFKGIIKLNEKKLWWHVSNGRRQGDFVSLKIKTDAIPPEASNITISAQNKFFDDYKTQNVIGYIEGKIYPDSFFVFTAHYDHLGRMGTQTYFPGANDNASGTAMIIDLARYYSIPENRPDYSIVFMAFSGEEAGLIGSTYFANNPLFPLKNIKFLINLDMVGSGSDGITVVNSSIFAKAYNLLVAINNNKQYLKEVKKRGEACNSDHCPFYKKGVPAVFIYTRGKECSEYHTPDDKAENLPLTEYDDLFRLLTDFILAF
ncbi:MAG: M28 family peptidase [Bacteroidales bacterium]|nr:M28 family peptidase [Bacteroidales bacterium]